MWNRGVLGILFVLATGTAHAQTIPYSLFQYASITGSGNTITATGVPVVISAGVTVYVTLTMQFTPDSNGNLTLAAGFPQVIPAPNLLTSSFRAGTYVGPSTVNNGNSLITVSGPGVTAGGTTAWSLTLPSGSDVNTVPTSAQWYVGPIATNPLAARLQSAGITSTAWSYGVGGAPRYGGSFWANNSLIGVSQIGNTITIVSFTNSGVDKSLPVDQITYTLKP